MFKIIAALLMLLDHIVYIFSANLSSTQYMVGRSIGRLAFPMFAYALARGYNRTSDRSKYFIRLSLFSVFTQLLFNLVTTHLNLETFLFQNVIITFTLAVAILIGMNFIENSSLDMMLQLRPICSEGTETKTFSPGGIRIPAWMGKVIGLIIIALSLFVLARVKPDYDYFGVGSILIFQRLDKKLPAYERHMNRRLKTQRWGMYLLFYTLITSFYCLSIISSAGWQFFAWIEMLSIPAVFLFPIYEHDKKPGTFSKYFFYFFYPLHYVLLLLIRATTM